MGYIISSGEVSSGYILSSYNYLTVLYGGTVNSTTVNEYGSLYVSSGGTANSTTVNFYGSMWVSSGGTATQIRENGGYIDVQEGANVTFASNTFSGLVLSRAAATIHSGTTANSNRVNEYGKLWVSSGGVADNTAVAGVSDDRVGRIYVLSGGVVNNTTVYKNGELYVSSGGTANSTTVYEYGYLYVSSGGTANINTVNANCMIYVLFGGVANSATVYEHGWIYVSSGGRLTGRMTFAPGAHLFLKAGSVIDFDLTQTRPDADALINDFMFIDSNPSFTLTVDSTLSSGYYRLADMVEAFSKTITVVNSSGTELGTLTVGGGTQTIGSKGYTLTLDGGVLGVTLDSVDTEKPTVKNTAASITTATNQNVTVTADFADDVAVASKLYRIGDGAWTDYADGVTVTENATVYFKAVDTSGKESDVAIFTIDYIDKVAPTITDITPSTTEPALSVTVTANFADDVALASQQYRIGDGAWQDYVDGVSVTENTTVNFLATDTAGNQTNAGYDVTNIKDTTKPVVSDVKSNITSQTNKNVTVTANFSDDVALKSSLYKINDGAWTDYTTGVTVTENATIYFKAVDTSGNESEVASYAVTNIDKVPPEKPTFSADITEPTNQNVTVTAAFPGDSVKNEYSMDGTNWAAYSGGIILEENGSVWFRATDAVGNVSEDAKYTVENIDKIPPAKPTASADVTAPTNGNALVSAQFSEDSAVKEYSLDGENWQVYTTPVSFTENGSVFFRGTDAAGNVSEVTNFLVDNIVIPDNKPDTGKDDVLYDKKTGWNDANISVTNTITGNGEINLDAAGSVNTDDGYHNMFGNDGTNTDAGDVAKISVAQAVKLTFKIESTAAGTFYVYEDGFDKKGNRAQITVGKVSVKAGKAATLKDVCLTAKGNYYVAMTAKNVKKAGTEGLYNVNVTDSTFFVDADEGANDTAKDNYLVWIGRGAESTPIILDGSPMSGSTEFKNFVGFSDSIDYTKLDLTSSAYIRFSLTGEGDGKAKFTVWKYDTEKNKMSKVGGVTTLNAKNKYTATSKAQFLDVSGGRCEYYISMECSDAAKGKGVYYNVQVTADAVFFDSADDGRNNVVYDKKAKKFYPEDATHHFETTSIGGGTKAVKLDSDPVGDSNWENFVGYQDSADYAKIELASDGNLSFDLKATSNATFVVYKKGQDKKGNDTLVAIQTTKLTVAKDKDIVETGTDLLTGLKAGEYYVSMTAKSTKANDKGSVFYNVTATLDASVSSALEMPMAAAAYADSVQDKLFGESGNGLLASL